MQLPVKSEVQQISHPNGRATDIFPLPANEEFLFELLQHLFSQYWQQIVFGPMIDGAAYEMRCTQGPSKIDLSSGYLSVFFGVPHFHLCIGNISDNVDDELNRRKTHRAEFFRDRDTTGAPVSWGLRLFTGAGEQQLTVLFPNPFVTDDDKIRDKPAWDRLAIWDQLQMRYLGRPADPKDRTANGFTNM